MKRQMPSPSQTMQVPARFRWRHLLFAWLAAFAWLNGVITVSATSHEGGSVEVVSVTLPTGRYGASAVWDGSSAYIFGGNDGNPLRQILRYNPLSGTVTTMSATLPEAQSGAGAVWDGSNAYIFGGRGEVDSHLNQIVRYNPSTDTVTTMSAVLPTGRDGVSAVWDGSNAYIFGGSDGSLLNSIVRYSPTTDAVTTMAGTLPTGRSATSAIWDGASAYVLGGADGSYLNQIVRYTPTTDAVTTMSATLPTAGIFFCAIWDGANAYVFGGIASHSFLNQVVRYSPATDTVTTLTVTLPTAMAATNSAAWIGPSAYIFGGWDGSTHPRDQILRFTPAADSVGSTPAAPLVPPQLVPPQSTTDFGNIQSWAVLFLFLAIPSAITMNISAKRRNDSDPSFWTFWGFVAPVVTPVIWFSVWHHIGKKKERARQRAKQQADEVRAATERQAAQEVIVMKERARQREEEAARQSAARTEAEVRRVAARKEAARRAELDALATRIGEIRKRWADLGRKHPDLRTREIVAAISELPKSGATDTARPLVDAAEHILRGMDTELQRRAVLLARSAEIRTEHRGLSARLGRGEIGQASFDRAFQALEAEEGDIANEMDQLDARLFEDKSEKPV